MERYERILLLIKRKSTGTPEELARRLNISESTLYEHIRVLRERGAQIEYCPCRQSYLLQNDFTIAFGSCDLELNKLRGGRVFFSSLRKYRSGHFYTCGA